MDVHHTLSCSHVWSLFPLFKRFEMVLNKFADWRGLGTLNVSDLSGLSLPQQTNRSTMTSEKEKPNSHFLKGLFDHVLQLR